MYEGCSRNNDSILLYWHITSIVDAAGMAAGGETSNKIPLDVVAM